MASSTFSKELNPFACSFEPSPPSDTFFLNLSATTYAPDYQSRSSQRLIVQAYELNNMVYYVHQGRGQKEVHRQTQPELQLPPNAYELNGTIYFPQPVAEDTVRTSEVDEKVRNPTGPYVKNRVTFYNKVDQSNPVADPSKDWEVDPTPLDQPTNGVLGDKLALKDDTIAGKFEDACTDLQVIKADEEHHKQSRRMEYFDNGVHHFNFLNQPVAGKSSALPATSLAIIMTPPKARLADDELSLSVHVLLHNAYVYIDPILYYGPPSTLYSHKGSKLQDAVTESCVIYHTPFGWWRNDDYAEDEELPYTDLMDIQDYDPNNGVANGWYLNHNIPTRDHVSTLAKYASYITSDKIKTDVAYRRKNGSNKSPLSQIINASDFAAEADVEWVSPKPEEHVVARSFAQEPNSLGALGRTSDWSGDLDDDEVLGSVPSFDIPGLGTASALPHFSKAVQNASSDACTFSSADASSLEEEDEEIYGPSSSQCETWSSKSGPDIETSADAAAAPQCDNLEIELQTLGSNDENALWDTTEKSLVKRAEQMSPNKLAEIHSPIQLASLVSARREKMIPAPALTIASPEVYFPTEQNTGAVVPCSSIASEDLFAGDQDSNSEQISLSSALSSTPIRANSRSITVESTTISSVDCTPWPTRSFKTSRLTRLNFSLVEFSFSTKASPMVAIQKTLVSANGAEASPFGSLKDIFSAKEILSLKGTPSTKASGLPILKRKRSAVVGASATSSACTQYLDESELIGATKENVAFNLGAINSHKLIAIEGENQGGADESPLAPAPLWAIQNAVGNGFDVEEIACHDLFKGIVASDSKLLIRDHFSDSWSSIHRPGALGSGRLLPPRHMVRSPSMRNGLDKHCRQARLAAKHKTIKTQRAIEDVQERPAAPMSSTTSRKQVTFNPQPVYSRFDQYNGFTPSPKRKRTSPVSYGGETNEGYEIESESDFQKGLRPFQRKVKCDYHPPKYGLVDEGEDETFHLENEELATASYVCITDNKSYSNLAISKPDSTTRTINDRALSAGMEELLAGFKARRPSGISALEPTPALPVFKSVARPTKISTWNKVRSNLGRKQTVPNPYSMEMRQVTPMPPKPKKSTFDSVSSAVRRFLTKKINVLK